MSYYIKKHYRALDDYPCSEVHFSQRALHQAYRFSQAKGFLLYEAGGSKAAFRGAKTLYAYGVPAGEPYRTPEPRIRDGKEYPYAVPINLKGMLKDRTRGISAELLHKQYGLSLRPILGGLVLLADPIYSELICILTEKIRDESREGEE